MLENGAQVHVDLCNCQLYSVIGSVYFLFGCSWWLFMLLHGLLEYDSILDIWTRISLAFIVLLFNQSIILEYDFYRSKYLLYRNLIWGDEGNSEVYINNSNSVIIKFFTFLCVYGVLW